MTDDEKISRILDKMQAQAAARPGSSIDPLLAPTGPAYGGGGGGRSLDLLMAGIEYRILEGLQQNVNVLDARNMATLQARSSQDLNRADIAAISSQDSSFFGAGRGVRWLTENTLGGPTLRDRVSEVMRADAGEGYAKGVFGLAGRIQGQNVSEAMSAAGLQGSMPSVEMRTRAQIGMEGVKADADLRRAQQSYEMNRDLGVINRNYEAGRLSTSEWLEQHREVQDRESLRGRGIQADVAHGQAQYELETRRANIAFGDENVRRTVGMLGQAGALAMRVGAGGEDIAFENSQTAARLTQRRRQQKGESTQEETDALDETQNARREQRERDISLRIKGIRSEAQQDYLATQGRFYDQEKEKFEQSARERMMAARNLGQNEINALKADLDQQRQLMEQQHAWEMEAAKRSSDVRVSASRAGAETDTLRARGEFYNADEREFKASWDRKVQAAKDALANEHDVERQAMRRAELAAVQDEAGGALAARRGLQARDISIRGENVADTELRAQGKNYTAQLKEIRDHADREVSDARGNGPLQRRIREQEAADIKQEQFNIKQVGLNRPGEAVRHNFEQDLSGRLLGRNPFENLSDVMKSSDTTLKSIEGWLKQQAALAAP